ncbi:hypothetical protein [Bacillus marinisedimentorum]|nr:hypothetical protein [Bacillus marinisedimentorum]
MVEMVVNLVLLGLIVFLLLILNEMGKDLKRIANALEDEAEERKKR